MDTVDGTDEPMKPLQIEGLVAADLTGEESKILVDQVAQRHLHTQSCHSPWSLTSVYFINNETLNGRYREKKAAMEKAGCTETQLEDTFVFTYFKEESALQDVVNNGLGCRQTKFNILGNTGSGVYVCKHADVQQRIAERTNPETYLITVYKLMLGRTLEVEPSSTGQQMMSPTLGYDCHVSTQAPQATDQLHKQFLHSQLYVYDLDEAGDALSQPQQLVPQAVLMYSRHSQAPASPSATAVDSAETSASDTVELDIFDSLLASAISEHFDHVQPELPTQPTNEQLPETEITVAIPELPNQPTNEQRPEAEITVDIPNVGELPTLDASDIQLEGASGDASLDATKSSLDNIPHMLDASDIQLEGASEDASLDATKSSLDSIPHMLDESKTSIDSIPAGSPLSMMSPALQTSSEEDINSKMEDALAVMAKICSDDSDIGGTPQHSADSQLDQAPHLAVLSQQDEMPEKEKESMPLAEPVVSKDVELTLKKIVRQIECGRTLRVKIKRLKVDRKVWDIPSKGKMKKSKSERDSLKESNKIGPKSKQYKTSESKVSSAKKNTDKKKVITKNKDTDRKEFKSKILISSSDSSDDSGSDDDGMDIKSKINRILSRHSSDKIRSKVSEKKATSSKSVFTLKPISFGETPKVKSNKKDKEKTKLKMENIFTDSDESDVDSLVENDKEKKVKKEKLNDDSDTDTPIKERKKKRDKPEKKVKKEVWSDDSDLDIQVKKKKRDKYEKKESRKEKPSGDDSDSEILVKKKKDKTAKQDKKETKKEVQSDDSDSEIRVKKKRTKTEKYDKKDTKKEAQSDDSDTERVKNATEKYDNKEEEKSEHSDSEIMAKKKKEKIKKYDKKETKIEVPSDGSDSEIMAKKEKEKTKKYDKKETKQELLSDDSDSDTPEIKKPEKSEKKKKAEVILPEESKIEKQNEVEDLGDKQNSKESILKTNSVQKDEDKPESEKRQIVDKDCSKTDNSKSKFAKNSVISDSDSDGNVEQSIKPVKKSVIPDTSDEVGEKSVNEFSKKDDDASVKKDAKLYTEGGKSKKKGRPVPMAVWKKLQFSPKYQPMVQLENVMKKRKLVKRFKLKKRLRRLAEKLASSRQPRGEPEETSIQALLWKKFSCTDPDEAREIQKTIDKLKGRESSEHDTPTRPSSSKLTDSTPLQTKDIPDVTKGLSSISKLFHKEPEQERKAVIDDSDTSDSEIVSAPCSIADSDKGSSKPTDKDEVDNETDEEQNDVSEKTKDVEKDWNDEERKKEDKDRPREEKQKLKTKDETAKKYEMEKELEFKEWKRLREEEKQKEMKEKAKSKKDIDLFGTALDHASKTSLKLNKPKIKPKHEERRSKGERERLEELKAAKLLAADAIPMGKGKTPDKYPLPKYRKRPLIDIKSGMASSANPLDVILPTAKLEEIEKKKREERERREVQQRWQEEVERRRKQEEEQVRQEELKRKRIEEERELCEQQRLEHQRRVMEHRRKVEEKERERERLKEERSLEMERKKQQEQLEREQLKALQQEERRKKIEESQKVTNKLYLPAPPNELMSAVPTGRDIWSPRSRGSEDLGPDISPEYDTPEASPSDKESSPGRHKLKLSVPKSPVEPPAKRRKPSPKQKPRSSSKSRRHARKEPQIALDPTIAALVPLLAAARKSVTGKEDPKEKQLKIISMFLLGLQKIVGDGSGAQTSKEEKTKAVDSLVRDIANNTCTAKKESAPKIEIPVQSEEEKPKPEEQKTDLKEKEEMKPEEKMKPEPEVMKTETEETKSNEAITPFVIGANKEEVKPSTSEEGPKVIEQTNSTPVEGFEPIVESPKHVESEAADEEMNTTDKRPLQEGLDEALAKIYTKFQQGPSENLGPEKKGIALDILLSSAQNVLSKITGQESASAATSVVSSPAPASNASIPPISPDEEYRNSSPDVKESRDLEYFNVTPMQSFMGPQGKQLMDLVKNHLNTRASWESSPAVSDDKSRSSSPFITYPPHMESISQHALQPPLPPPHQESSQMVPPGQVNVPFPSLPMPVPPSILMPVPPVAIDSPTAPKPVATVQGIQQQKPKLAPPPMPPSLLTGAPPFLIPRHQPPSDDMELDEESEERSRIEFSGHTWQPRTAPWEQQDNQNQQDYGNEQWENQYSDGHDQTGYDWDDQYNEESDMSGGYHPAHRGIPFGMRGRGAVMRGRGGFPRQMGPTGNFQQSSTKSQVSRPGIARGGMHNTSILQQEGHEHPYDQLPGLGFMGPRPVRPQLGHHARHQLGVHPEKSQLSVQLSRPGRPQIGFNPNRPHLDEQTSGPMLGIPPVRPQFVDGPIRPQFGSQPVRPQHGDGPIRPPFGSHPVRPALGEGPGRPPLGVQPVRTQLGDGPIMPGLGIQPFGPQIGGPQDRPQLNVQPQRPQDVQPVQMNVPSLMDLNVPGRPQKPLVPYDEADDEESMEQEQQKSTKGFLQQPAIMSLLSHLMPDAAEKIQKHVNQKVKVQVIGDKKRAKQETRQTNWQTVDPGESVTGRDEATVPPEQQHRPSKRVHMGLRGPERRRDHVDARDDFRARLRGKTKKQEEEENNAASTKRKSNVREVDRTIMATFAQKDDDYMRRVEEGYDEGDQEYGDKFDRRSHNRHGARGNSWQNRHYSDYDDDYQHQRRRSQHERDEYYKQVPHGRVPHEQGFHKSIDPSYESYNPNYPTPRSNIPKHMTSQPNKDSPTAKRAMAALEGLELEDGEVMDVDDYNDLQKAREALLEKLDNVQEHDDEVEEGEIVYGQTGDNNTNNAGNITDNLLTFTPIAKSNADVSKVLVADQSIDKVSEEGELKSGSKSSEGELSPWE